VNKVPSNILHSIGVDLLDLCRRGESEIHRLSMKDYHGFKKCRVPPTVLDPILATYEVSPIDVQIEIVSVLCDLIHETHIHKVANAYIMVLGAVDRFDDPVDAYALRGKKWMAVTPGQIIDVPACIPHTVTVLSGGIVHFLSVQSPPIERNGGDDYYKVTSSTPFPYAR